MRSRGGALLLGLVTALAPAAHAQPPPPSCDGRPATIVGTEQADSIEGTPGHDVIAGLGGDDVIRGLAGGDDVCGGAGADTIHGDGSGDPDEESVDDVWGEDGDDVLHGLGGWGSGKLHGGPGDDVFVGGPASFERSPAPVLVDLSTGDAAGEGRDTLVDVDVVYGSPYDDVMRGSERVDDLSGGAGNDRLSGAAGADLLTGDEGDDVLSGGRGSDWHLHGGEGSDAIHGGRGADVLYGEADPDEPEGFGDDFLAGDDGRDTAIFRLGSREIGVTVDLRSGTADGHGADRLYSIEDVLGGDGPDRIYGDGRANELEGGGGGDVILGRGGDDRLVPHYGSATGAAPGDVVRGARGRDELYAECCPGTSVHGGPGRDLVSFAYAYEAGGVTVDLARGSYAFLGGSGELSSIRDVVGTSDDDTLFGDVRANSLDGGYGPDVVRGRAGDDQLDGGGARDEVFGGPGRDRCGDRRDRLEGCEVAPH